MSEQMSSSTTMPASLTSGAASPTISDDKLPPCLLVLGMAGSGKTSFVQRLTSHLHVAKKFPYVVNLDPAVADVPYPVNIDIRDTIQYKAIMKEYGLGPNGAIITCLNLICTRLNLILDVFEKRKHATPYFVIDTPGQIEAFTWSASGAVITDSLASRYPTVIAYVVDSARATSPTTFMSNMLYACSILYRTKLPFFIVFNKSDLVNPEYARKWMTNFEAFQNAVDTNKSSYMNDLTRSLSLVLDTFYENMNNVCVSARTGEGFDEVLAVIEKCRQEYWNVYKPMYEQLQKDKAVEEELRQLSLNEDGVAGACEMEEAENSQ